MHPCPSSASSRLPPWHAPRPSTWPTSRPRWSDSPGPRLACAEASLSDPQLATPAGLIAARIGRAWQSAWTGSCAPFIRARPGAALAARFARSMPGCWATRPTAAAIRPGRRGRLWLLERRIRPGAAAWLFDDLPFAAVDEVAADALTATARALLRRPAPVVVWAEAATPATPWRRETAASRHDPLQDTLIAVARSNGRVAPAARLLGVHRNTVSCIARGRGTSADRPAPPAGRAADPVRDRRASIAADAVIDPCAQCTRIRRAYPDSRALPPADGG